MTRSFLLVLLLIATAVSAGVAAVRTDDAVAVERAVETASRYRGWTVAAFEVAGMPEGLAAPLKAGLQLAGRKGLLRTRRSPLFPVTLRDDVERTRIFLAVRGYPWATVAVALRPERDKHALAVIFAVDPGPVVRVAEVEVSGVPEDLDHAAATATLTPGSRFSEATLESAAGALADRLRASGYPTAAVASSVALRDSTRAFVTLAATPGPRCRFDRTILEGVPPGLDPLVRKNAEPPADALFSPRALSDARRNLRELGLFRRVAVEADPPRGELVDLRVNTVPLSVRSVEMDVGYWSDEFLKVGARWRHRRLLGGGRGAELSAGLSKFRRHGACDVWWPSVLGPRTRVTARLSATGEFEESYDLRSLQTELWVVRRVGAAGRLQTGVTVADVRVDDESADPTSFLSEDGLLTALHLRANFDHVDDPVDPSRGYAAASRIEWSPPWLPSDNSYLLGAFDVAWYLDLGPAVLASRVDVGLAGALGSSVDLLPNKRFFAGGATSMRGARRRMLGPLDSDGDPVGGAATLLYGAELRIGVKGPLKAVLFADAGDVWSRIGDFDVAGLETAVGPGLMVLTPVGPVRADVAFNLTERPSGEPDVVLHVSVGHPF